MRNLMIMIFLLLIASCRMEEDMTIEKDFNKTSKIENRIPADQSEIENEVENPLLAAKSKPCELNGDEVLECGQGLCGSWIGNGYHVYESIPLVFPCEEPCSVTLTIEEIEVPNRFTVYNSKGIEVTSEWIGWANYPGPWGSSLGNPGPPSLTFVRDPGQTYTLVIETSLPSKGKPDRFGSDTWEVFMHCDCPCEVGCVDDCGGNFSGQSSTIGYQVYSNTINLECLEEGCEVTLTVHAYDVPNRFNINVGGALVTSDWLGVSTVPGPWGYTPDNGGYYIHRTGTVTMSFIKGAEDSVVLETETVVIAGTDPFTDNWWVGVQCNCETGVGN